MIAEHGQLLLSVFCASATAAVPTATIGFVSWREDLVTRQGGTMETEPRPRRLSTVVGDIWTTDTALLEQVLGSVNDPLEPSGD